MILLLWMGLTLSQMSEAANEVMHEGGSCGKNSIPSKIVVDRSGRPDLFCEETCLGEQYLHLSKKRHKRTTARDLVVVCDDYDETLCDHELKWTGGLSEVNNGTHRTLKTECCSYPGMELATEVKTVMLEAGDSFVGGSVGLDTDSGYFDLIKEVRKTVADDNSVKYVVIISRLPCTVNKKAFYKSTLFPRTGVSRSKRRLSTEKDSLDYEDDRYRSARRHHPYAAREVDSDRPIRRRRPARRRPIYEEYYDYDYDYPYLRRKMLRRNRVRMENRLWPVNYARPRQLTGEVYMPDEALHLDYPTNDMVRVESGSSVGGTAVIQKPPVLNAKGSPTYQQSGSSATFSDPGPLPPPDTSYVPAPVQSPAPPPPMQYIPAPQQAPTYVAAQPETNYIAPDAYQTANNLQQDQLNQQLQQQQQQQLQQQQQPQQQAAQQPQVQYQPAYYPAGGSSLNSIFGNMQCFSGDMEVETPTGPKAIRDVKVGDLVMSIDESMITFSPVIMLLHKIDDEEAEFHKLTMDSGHSLELTAYHLIYITNCGVNEPLKLIHAKNIELGQCVHIVDKKKSLMKQRVMMIEKIIGSGYYSPLTTTGDIIVNRVLSSCHSNLGLKTLQQTFFSVYRTASATFNRLLQLSGRQDGELPYGVEYLTTVMDLFLPKTFL